MEAENRPGAEAPSREEAIRLLEGGYGRVILETATHYTAPIFWGDPSAGDGSGIIDNGCVFFVECGGPVFAVTCDHVIDGYMRAKSQNSTIICQIAETVVNLEDRILDRDSHLDLATLTFSATEVERLGKWIYTRSPDRWPPDPPEEGKGVFFAGFPANQRRSIENNQMEFGIYTGLGVATRVTSDRIVYQYERDYFVDVLRTGIPAEHQWLGGLSGAPLWTVTSLGWRLGGVIYQWSTHYELLYARRANAIACDGTLIRMI